MKKKLITLFLLAFFLRLIAINQSLWLDEAISARVVKSFSFWQIVNQFSPYDFHPPLYYLFLKFWTNVFGYSELALRLPSVIFSLVTGWLVYLSAKLIKNKKVGFWAAVFFLFNPLIVYYSQEARMYMMTTCFLAGALYYLISNIKNQKSKIHIKDQIFFYGFLLLSLFTFYGSLFMMAAYLFYFLYKKQYKNLTIGLLVLFGYLLTISPLLLQQLKNSQLSLNEVKNWSLVLGKANLKNLLLIPIKFSIGRISFYPKWFYWLVAGFWTSIVFLSLKEVFLKNKKIFYQLSFLFIFPLLAGFLISFFKPLLQYFRFIYLIIILSISLALIDSIKIKKFLASGFLFFSLIYLFFPQFHREDWKGLSQFLTTNKIYKVYMINSSSDPLVYYSKQKLNILGLQQVCQKDIILKKKKNKVFIIPYSAEIWGIDYKRCLKENDFSLFLEKNFRQLKIEGYQFNY